MADETNTGNRATSEDVDRLANWAPGARQTSNGRNAEAQAITDSPHGRPDEAKFSTEPVTGDSRDRAPENTRAFVSGDRLRPALNSFIDRIESKVSLSTLATIAVSAGMAFVWSRFVSMEPIKKVARATGAPKAKATTKASKQAEPRRSQDRPRARAKHETRRQNAGPRVKRGNYDGSISSRDFVVTGHRTGSGKTEMEAMSHQVSIDAGRVPHYPIDGE